MKISVCTNTARGDYAMLGLPNIHIFEYCASALRNQTFKDFEWVIADVLHDTRSDYFQKHPEDFPVQHVSVKPNVWTKRGLVAISASKNTCLLYAKGEIIVFIDDCCWINETYLEDILKEIQPDHLITNPYEVYNGEILKGKENLLKEKKQIGGSYGNVSLYLERYLELNGYNELFDGNRGLEDCEFSVRVIKHGMKIFKIPNYTRFQNHNAYPSLKEPGVKCCRLAEFISNKRIKYGILKANTISVTNEEMEKFKECVDIKKGYICPYVRLPCNQFDKNGNCISGVNKELLELYRHPSLIFDLREQRKDIDKTIEHLRSICAS